MTWLWYDAPSPSQIHRRCALRRAAEAESPSCDRRVTAASPPRNHRLIHPTIAQVRAAEAEYHRAEASGVMCPL